MSKNIIELVSGKSGDLVSSQTISAGIGVQHKATFTLIKKHKNLLETFGSLEFEIPVKSKTGKEKHALLNEDQAIFLLTLSRNTEQVVTFKHALTKLFGKYRRESEMRANVGWQQNRELGKLTRRELTDVIQPYVNYAKAQGSRGAGHYYTNITKLLNTTLGIDDRDTASENSLHLLATAEHIAEQYLNKGMADQLPYKAIYQGLKRQMEQLSAMLEIADG